MVSSRYLLIALLLSQDVVFAGPNPQQSAEAKQQSTAGAAQEKPVPAGKERRLSQENVPDQANLDQTEEEAEQAEELAPAAVKLDVSQTSPLIQRLYQATRETKEQAILASLDAAKQLIDAAVDVNALDAQHRTALHWTVFGSSYSSKPKIRVAYEEIADSLIGKGVDINKEDIYNDTALDYLLYSPNFEMQTLLLEHGASSGFLASFFHFFNRGPASTPMSFKEGAALAMRADLAPGQTIDVRLSAPVYSDRSRTGDPFEATVTYPLCVNGELVECEKGELLLAPGTKINGTILFAQKAADKYSRPRLVLDFSNIMHKSGQISPLYARVLGVDNARESVRNNEILGIIQPHASKKMSLAMAAVSAATPIAGYTVRGIQTVYGLSIRREVLLPAGTDLQIQVVRPSMLTEREAWGGWPKMGLDPQLQSLVNAAPLRTQTAGKVLSDVTNLMFIGSEQEIRSAFAEAGWYEADDLSFKSAAKTLGATVRQANYSTAPVSALLVDGRRPDLVFQKSLDTFAQRHHLRIWKQTSRYSGREVWIGAATHDIAISNARAGTKWSHRIDSHIDRERDWIQTDLLFVGTAAGYLDVDRAAAPRKTANATGDTIVTDGKMTVLSLAGGEHKSLVTRGSQ